MSNIIDEINSNNMLVARVGGVCQVHNYSDDFDPRYIDKPYNVCLSCGMKSLRVTGQTAMSLLQGDDLKEIA